MSHRTEQSVPPLFVLQEHAHPVLSCNFYPSEGYQRDESNWFLTGDAGGVVVLWNLLTRRKIVSFSVLTEAYRQLRGGSQLNPNSSTPTGGDSVPAKQVLPEQASTSAFGAHSPSILSVGFIPLSLSPRKHTLPTAHCGDVVNVLGTDINTTLSSAAVCPTAAEFAARGTTGWKHQGRQRFRLPRRASTPCGLTGQASYPTAGDVVDSSAPEITFTPSSTICFYTHCRDQRLYIWCLGRPCAGAPPVPLCDMEPKLIVVLTAPQHGFCPVESISKALGSLTRTYLAVPHDSGGEVTIWELEWRQPNSTHLASEVEKEKAALDRPPYSPGYASECEGEEEEVNTSELNPMDALIARAAAEERRRAKMEQKSCRLPGESEGDHLFSSAGLPTSFVSKGERSSTLCYVDPTATAMSSNFSVRPLCTFSACPTFKGGTIMRLTMCRDAEHVAVAFESGHIVLVRYQNGIGSGVSNQPGERCDARGHSSVAQVRHVTRAFAESALVCWCSGDRMVACSAEGGIHCYNLMMAAGGLLEAQLAWSVTLRKGIGSVFLQRNLVVAGCWDSTLRLYDVRDGRLVSILSYQREAVNEVRMAPSTIARVAAFGFDVRHPKLYGDLPNASCTTTCIASSTPAIKQESTTRCCESPPSNADVLDTQLSTDLLGSQAAEEDLVYLFASASKDNTVALWRVDLGVVVEEQAARKFLTAGAP